MDAFFASCELSRYPELRGVPMVVAGRGEHQPTVGADGHRHFSRLRDYVGRGVLTTATYEARALGVHSGMPTMKAARLAPDAVLLPVNFELYRQYSRRFKDAVRSVTPIIQDVGIDEIYADCSALPEDSAAIALRIRQAVRQATDLSCSVGIAPNKLLAKLASDMDKPDGSTILREEDLRTRVWPLPVGKVNGIGPKANARLAQLGILRLGELAQADPALLQQTFGTRYAHWLQQVANGHDDRPLVTASEPSSISRETTFERDLHVRQDRARLSEAFTELCVRVGEDLRRKGYRGRSIGIKLRFDDFRTVTRALSLDKATDDAATIRHTASQCLKRVPLERRIRLLGVRVAALERRDAHRTPEPEQGHLLFEVQDGQAH